MDTRLIAVAFPLKQASLDSAQQEHARHRHISALHIFWARKMLDSTCTVASIL
jgi:putative DNA methylase